MGDLGTLAFDQGSGSGLGTIDDKTPTAAEEIWDGLDGTTVNGLVGAAGSSGVWNYIKTVGGVTFNGAARKVLVQNTEGASSGAGQSAWDFALTGTRDMLGIDGLSWGAGYGEASSGEQTVPTTGMDHGDAEHFTGFITYSMGPMTS